MYIINYHTYLGIIVHSPSNVTYLPGVTPLPIELTCDVTQGLGWIVNNNGFLFNQIASGLPGHNHNGENIVIINTPINNTQYTCSDGIIIGQPYYTFVAGEYADFSTATI